MSHSIKKLIRNAEKVPLSGKTLKDITNGECNIIAYEQLMRVSTIDEAFKGKKGLILLYQQEPDFGHWVLLWKQDSNTLRFFDSLGYQVDEELPFSKHNLQNHKGRLVPHLTTLIDKSNYKLIQNKTKFQKNKRDENTCGRWCAVMFRMREYSVDEFKDLFDDVDGDYMVSAMTILYSKFNN